MKLSDLIRSQAAQVNQRFTNTDGRAFTVVQTQHLSNGDYFIIIQFDDDDSYEKVGTESGRIYHRAATFDTFKL